MQRTVSAGASLDRDNLSQKSFNDIKRDGARLPRRSWSHDSLPAAEVSFVRSSSLAKAGSRPLRRSLSQGSLPAAGCAGSQSLPKAGSMMLNVEIQPNIKWASQDECV